MLKQILLLHSLCFPNQKWNEKDLSELKKSGCDIITSENSFIIYKSVLDETEIISIGVHPLKQNQGIGQSLLIILEKNLKNQKRIFLEVAENNNKAINLYIKSGYKIIGKRKNYYQEKSKNIDALIMRKDLF